MAQSPSTDIDSDRLVEGPYLLRRERNLEGRLYRAGTVVEHREGKWYLFDEINPAACPLPIDPSMVCKGAFEGLSLYVVECVMDGSVMVQSIFGEGQPLKEPPALMGLSPKPGESFVCVRFGCCFLPLELLDL